MSPTPAEAAADALLAALSEEVGASLPQASPACLAGCATGELLQATRRMSPAGAPVVVSALTAMAYALGGFLREVDPGVREGVLRVLKQRLNDGARGAESSAGAQVH